MESVVWMETSDFAPKWLEASSHDRTLRFKTAGCEVRVECEAAHRRESDKGGVGARGASTAGMVRCWQGLLFLCRSCLIFVLAARLHAALPMKDNSTYFETLAKANRGRRCLEPKQKKTR